MAKTLLIEGNKSLKGEVIISGSKNCALCLIAAALLTKDITIINDVPDIIDIRRFIKILNYLNVETIFENNSLTINPSKMINKNLNIEDVRKFRASYYLIGALINNFKHMEIAKMGGCNFVPRPINYHIDLFKNFGIDTVLDDDTYSFEMKENKGDTFTLPYPSFGTSVNAILLSVSLNRHIVIKNLTKEVEFIHFVEMLKRMGANITLEDNNAIIEKSVLHGITFANIPDRIETGTFIMIGVTNCDYLKIKHIEPLHNRFLFDLLSLLDVQYDLGDDYVVLNKQKIEKSIIVETGEDALSSDLQPLLSVLCLCIPRISIIKEKVYEARFTHIEPLKKMGGFIIETNQNILINGIMNLIGTEVVATDLRMAASMVYAGLNAEGKTIIHNSDYIDRGYEKFIDKLISIGADITSYEE